MLTFLKSQLTSIAATLVDFCLTIVGVELFALAQGFASGVGNTGGAYTSFVLNRKWAFSAEQNKLGTQVGRYVLVWCGYFIINVSLVSLITTFTSIHYIIVKTGVAILLSISYNYGLYKKYVFK